MTAADILDELTDHAKDMLIMSLLGGIAAAEEAADKKLAIKCLLATANRYGLMDQLRKDNAEFDAREAARQNK